MPWFVLFAFFFLFPFSSFASSFSDVPENHEYYPAIESLKNLGVLSGFSDGTFHPEDSVTRAEAIKMIFESSPTEIPEDASAPPEFSDVPKEAWFFRYIQFGRKQNIINGYAQTGKFGPNDPVQKAEFLKIVLLVFEKDLTKHQHLSTFAADITDQDWSAPYMSYGKTLGLIVPDPENRLFPHQELTRGECAEILYRLLILERGGEVQKLLRIAESSLVNILIALGERRIDDALKDANIALWQIQEAKKIAPEEPLVQAAEDIVQGFLELVLAHQSGLSGDTASLKSHAEQAKNYAANAFEKDASTQPIGKRIKERADALLLSAP